MSTYQQNKQKLEISYEDLNYSTYFGKFKDINWIGEGSIEFVNNVVLKHPNKCIMLQNLSNIYVLVALQDFPSELLNHKQKKKWEDNNYRIVIGYIWIDEKHSEYKNINNDDGNISKHYIDFIDTRIRGLNLASYMMKQYENIHNCCIFPKEIITTAKNYWKKYFKKEYDLYTTEDYHRVVRDLNLYDNFIKWEELYYLLKIEEESNIKPVKKTVKKLVGNTANNKN
jgi:hypothetical protein